MTGNVKIFSNFSSSTLIKKILFGLFNRFYSEFLESTTNIQHWDLWDHSKIQQGLDIQNPAQEGLLDPQGFFEKQKQ